jgi:hypothetical protein
MNRYLVLCERPGGLFITQRPWCAMDMDMTLRDLRAGAFPRPVIVLRLNLIHGTLEDVTEQFQRECAQSRNAQDAIVGS